MPASSAGDALTQSENSEDEASGLPELLWVLRDFSLQLVGTSCEPLTADDSTGKRSCHRRASSPAGVRRPPGGLYRTLYLMCSVCANLSRGVGCGMIVSWV